MWIQVRSMDGRKCVRIDGLSKLTKIEDLREQLIEHFDAPCERQRLFCRGKQMVDGHTLFDYNVNLNEIVQILVKPSLVSCAKDEKSDINDNISTQGSNKENQEPEPSICQSLENSNIYKLGDVVDVRDDGMGAWFEASITKIVPSSEMRSNSNQTTVTDESTSSDKTEEKIDDDGYLYHIKYESENCEDAETVIVKAGNIRPRARSKIPLNKIVTGDKVMLNYNYDEPTSRGYWYDAIITGKQCTRTIKQLIATVYIGKDLVPFEDCKIVLVDEIFKIELPGTQLNMFELTSGEKPIAKRENKPQCDHCHDNPKRKCKHCSCCVCGDKKEPEKQLMCDECDNAYHLYCLNPPLDVIPEDDEWFCPECKLDTSQVVSAGEKLKESKKKSKMASSQSSTSRDWGKGMACVGRTKHCTIVPSNHFGTIPGVEVGSSWKFRVQVSEAGVHRPHVAGIHGREDEGAYSIVLSGGYEDDQDDGDVFTYTGSGGRDLSGNKRTAEQSCDQTLTRNNKALAKNCNAPIDVKKGAEATDWKSGKPVRVVRNCKGRKHSDYAPEEGNRYDGVYKIVKYWPEKGKSGFLVWRYLFRRDDPAPAPWTKEGKKRIAELGLTMRFPEGWEDSSKDLDESDIPKEKGKGKGKNKKKKVSEDEEEEEEDNEERKKKPNKKRKRSSLDEDQDESSKSKKNKVSYSLSKAVLKLINDDEQNQKLWEEALIKTSEGIQPFLSKVEELFLCICCQDIVCIPITTSCSHNMCKSCLDRSFKVGIYSCPACRNDLGVGYKMEINSNLREVLKSLFPGYESGK